MSPGDSTALSAPLNVHSAMGSKNISQELPDDPLTYGFCMYGPLFQKQSPEYVFVCPSLSKPENCILHKEMYYKPTHFEHRLITIIYTFV